MHVDQVAIAFLLFRYTRNAWNHFHCSVMMRGSSSSEILETTSTYHLAILNPFPSTVENHPTSTWCIRKRENAYASSFHIASILDIYRPTEKEQTSWAQAPLDKKKNPLFPIPLLPYHATATPDQAEDVMNKCTSKSHSRNNPPRFQSLRYCSFKRWGWRSSIATCQN